ncbi:MAG: hypothetical protein BRD55_04845 [Bacteroidetes bacterium SW_9_63_38]|nr:MAG: hypothetical protein BRD55_04845 [Bacteroidetes bacterium SW_9_63_38]
MDTCPLPRVLGVLSVGLLCMGISFVPADVLRIGAFSEQDPARTQPADWQPISFAEIDTKTQYDLVAGSTGTVVRARSDGGASGLATETRVDLTEYPILEWRWKVNGVVEDGNARTKDGDDYPARLYVTFDYDDLGFGDQVKLVALRALGYDEIPTRALNYVWANRVERDTILENVYTDWVMMVVVQSGADSTGQWRTERRNVLADYRAAFSGDPPPVNGVALMTDTDDTDGEATAYYGDIVFRTASGDSTDRTP